MILVKKRSLYILTFLFVLLLIFGEIKFFYAIRSVNMAANLDLKYEMENFIFASVVIIILVYLFLVNFMRTSDNILKRLDKMVELSEYGKYDIEAHLEKMGGLGKRVNYLTYHLNDLNNKRTLKISSLASMNKILVERSGEALFMADRHGDIIETSPKLSDVLGIAKKNITGRGMDEFFKGVLTEVIFFDLEKSRKALLIDDLVMKAAGKDLKCNVLFHPVFNADKEVSHIIGTVESG